MSNNLQSLHGVVHGKTIELDHEPGFPDGQAVVVHLSPLLPEQEAILRSAGGWAEDAAELDEFLADMRRSRQSDRPDIEP